jgi:hypothetical protein
MSANHINIGQELAGTKGAGADDCDFTTNIWATQALGPEYVFWYSAQIDTGFDMSIPPKDLDVSQNPPFAGWNSTPAFSPFLGGDFITRCC